MFGSKKEKQEWLPWYRVRDFKGNLTEAEKRELDSFRSLSKHPAITLEQLPVEAQNYIGMLELENYDAKQEKVAGEAMLVSALGLALLGAQYVGCMNATPSGNFIAGVFVIAPWFYYKKKWAENADKFNPKSADVPRPTDEALRCEWEVEYLGNKRRAERELD